MTKESSNCFLNGLSKPSKNFRSQHADHVASWKAGKLKVKGSVLLRAFIVRKNTTNQTMVPLRTNSGEYDDYLLFSVGDTLSAIRRISASSFTSALYSITQLISGEMVQQR